MVFDFQSRWEREGLQAGLEVGKDSSGSLTGGSGQDLKIGRMKRNSHMKTGSHINRTSNQRALSDSPVRGPKTTLRKRDARRCCYWRSCCAIAQLLDLSS